MISKHKTVITSQNWDRVVFDEAHHLRNINSETYKGASKLSTNIFWFISGTPIQNKFDDVYSLLFLLKYNKNDLQNKTVVQQLLRPLLIKRTKASVNLPMPSLSHYNLYIDWNNDDEKFTPVKTVEAIVPEGLVNTEALEKSDFDILCFEFPEISKQFIQHTKMKYTNAVNVSRRQSFDARKGFDARTQKILLKQMASNNNGGSE